MQRKQVTRNSLTFFTVIHKQETAKTLKLQYNFFIVRENLKDIANRSDNISSSYN